MTGCANSKSNVTSCAEKITASMSAYLRKHILNDASAALLTSGVVIIIAELYNIFADENLSSVRVVPLICTDEMDPALIQTDGRMGALKAICGGKAVAGAQWKRCCGLSTGNQVLRNLERMQRDLPRGELQEAQAARKATKIVLISDQHAGLVLVVMGKYQTYALRHCDRVYSRTFIQLSLPDSCRVPRVDQDALIGAGTHVQGPRYVCQPVDLHCDKDLTR